MFYEPLLLTMNQAIKLTGTIVFVMFMVALVMALSIPKDARTEKYKLIIDIFDFIFWIALIVLGCLFIWK